MSKLPLLSFYTIICVMHQPILFYPWIPASTGMTEWYDCLKLYNSILAIVFSAYFKYTLQKFYSGNLDTSTENRINLKS